MSSSEFVQLMRESVITQAIITVMMMALVTFMLVTGRVVPSELWALSGLVIGFYFGGKVQAQAMRLARSQAQTLEGDDGGEGRATPRRGTKV